MDMYISNLDASVQDEDLRGLFEPFGEVIYAQTVSNLATGLSKGYGFVEMRDETAGTTAIYRLNGRKVFDRRIMVLQAKCRA